MDAGHTTKSAFTPTPFVGHRESFSSLPHIAGHRTRNGKFACATYPTFMATTYISALGAYITRRRDTTKSANTRLLLLLLLLDLSSRIPPPVGNQEIHEGILH